MTRTLSLLFTLPLLLAGCSTAAKSTCISSSEAKAPPNFGSDAVAEAYADLPEFYFAPNPEDVAEIVVERTSDAIGRFDMTPEVETLFLRMRLAANEKLKNTSATRSDLERLISLDVLSPNEGPFLSQKVAALNSGINENLDRDAQPLVRVPPLMTRAALDGNKSGHCVLTFDVAPQGNPENVEIGYCTDDIFRQSSIDSVLRWKYNPAIRDGKAVKRSDVETTLRYKIQDACGNVLPE